MIFAGFVDVIVVDGFDDDSFETEDIS